MLANHIGDQVKMTMNMHVALTKPMTKTTVLALCRLTELLKVGS